MTISKLNEITYGCLSTIHYLDDCLWKISISKNDDLFSVSIFFLDGFLPVSDLIRLERKLSKNLNSANINISFNAVKNCFTYIYIAS